jgi:uncharacterized membrane protein YccC
MFSLVRLALRDWLREDAPTMIYIMKVLMACLLAMWLSLRFELDQPRTAMLTVAIVMQSRTGMVFAKSYYRLLGSIIGILVSFLLVALFAQERVLFLVSMAIWIGFCTAGSMLFRNHQSYAFVLAGYTICIVGLPATIAPELTFSIGVTRISEIIIGLISASLISDLIFPQRIGDLMTAKIRRRFSDFSDMLRAMSIEKVSEESSKYAALRIVSDVFELETFRASSGLENDASRNYRLRLSMLNAEFMQVSTSFHSLEQLLRRQNSTGHPQVVEALFSLYQLLKTVISVEDRSVINEIEAQQLTAVLKDFRSSLHQQIDLVRKALPESLDASERLDFESGTELLRRFVDELYVYTSTYASLGSETAAAAKNAIAEHPPRLGMHVDSLAVTLAGIRGALSLAAMACLWIFADWRSGIEAITIGIITSTLYASSPNPKKTVKQFIFGAILGSVFVYICNFQILPQAHGFLMLSLAVAPAIVIAAWLTTRPAVATIGSGIFIIFLMHIGFNSAYSANPITFMNDAVADLFAIATSGILYALIDLTSSGWSRRRIVKKLRELVVSACLEPLPQRPSRLETRARDLVQRLDGGHRAANVQDKQVIDCLLSTLEIGRAVIALRDQMNEVDDIAIKLQIAACLKRLAELYTSPSRRNQIDALNSINHAASALENSMLVTKLPQFTQHQLLTMLHFIRCALLDNDAVLPPHNPNATSREGAVYAA